MIIRCLLYVLVVLHCALSQNPARASDVDKPTTFVFPTYKHTYGIRKAGSTELFLFMGLRVKFNNPQGLACARLEAWDDPDNPHDDDEVTVYGVNSGQNNIIYNNSMWSLDVYGMTGSEEERLSAPNGICANSRGDVYVADSGNHRIVHLFNSGDKLRYVTSIGTSGSKPGQFLYPLQVAIDGQGSIYVSDTGNQRIQIFDKQHTLIRTIGNDGSIVSPNGIAVAHSSERHRYRNDNFIILVDSLDQRITKFDLSGNRIRSQNIMSTGFSAGRLEYVCLDYYNQVLITDSYNHCIHKFDRDLNHITSFGEKGDEDFQFMEPTGIAIYRRFGQLFIAEKTGAQYYWVGTDIENLEINSKQTSIIFSFNLTEPSFVYLDIYDEKNKFVKRIADKQLLHPAKRHRLFWNLRKSQKLPERIFSENTELSDIVPAKNLVPDGSYRAQITIEATYSSRSYFTKSITQPFEVRK